MKNDILFVHLCFVVQCAKIEKSELIFVPNMFSFDLPQISFRKKIIFLSVSLFEVVFTFSNILEGFDKIFFSFKIHLSTKWSLKH